MRGVRLFFFSGVDDDRDGDGEHPRWPTRLGEWAWRNLLPDRGEATPIPWTGSYWPTASDSINYRWAGEDSMSPAKKYGVAFNLTGVEDKVSRYHGIDSRSSARVCDADSECNGSLGEVCAKREGESEGRCIQERHIVYPRDRCVVDGNLSSEINRYTGRDTHEYIFELGATGAIVGGEWIGASKKNHPDFLWMPTGVGARSVAGGAIKFTDVNALADASVAPE